MVSPESVCVVLPVCDGMAHLKQTLDCLDSADMPSMFVLIADDESTDGSWLTCLRWSESTKHSVIAVRQGKRLGLTENLKQTVPMTPSSISAFLMLAQDDLITSELVIQGVDLLNRDIDVVISTIRVFTDDPRDGRVRVPISFRSRNLMLAMLLGSNGIPGTGALIRAGAYRSVLKVVNENSIQDWQQWVFLCINEKARFAWNQRALSSYRSHKSSMKAAPLMGRSAAIDELRKSIVQSQESRCLRRTFALIATGARRAQRAQGVRGSSPTQFVLNHMNNIWLQFYARLTAEILRLLYFFLVGLLLVAQRKVGSRMAKAFRGGRRQ